MSSSLSILITLVELAAVAGFYGSPGIIYRYSIKQSPCSPAFAKKFCVVLTAVFYAAVFAALKIAKQSLVPLLGIVIWAYFNYCILTAGYTDAKGVTVKGNFVTDLFEKFQEIIVYIIVGVLTTVVAWAVFYLLSLVLDSGNSILLAINTVLNWTAGVLVAYPMNRHWVFHSKNPEIFKEFLGFTASRVTTLVAEEVVMILCVNVLGIDQYISKYVIASILVIILNYVFSKLFVFRKGQSRQEK